MYKNAYHVAVNLCIQTYARKHKNGKENVNHCVETYASKHTNHPTSFKITVPPCIETNATKYTIHPTTGPRCGNTPCSSIGRGTGDPMSQPATNQIDEQVPRQEACATTCNQPAPSMLPLNHRVDAYKHIKYKSNISPKYNEQLLYINSRDCLRYH
jgi:hypothetical protein